MGMGIGAVGGANSAPKMAGCGMAPPVASPPPMTDVAGAKGADQTDPKANPKLAGGPIADATNGATGGGKGGGPVADASSSAALLQQLQALLTTLQSMIGQLTGGGPNSQFAVGSANNPASPPPLSKDDPLLGGKGVPAPSTPGGPPTVGPERGSLMFDAATIAVQKLNLPLGDLANTIENAASIAGQDGKTGNDLLPATISNFQGSVGRAANANETTALTAAAAAVRKVLDAGLV